MLGDGEDTYSEDPGRQPAFTAEALFVGDLVFDSERRPPPKYYTRSSSRGTRIAYRTILSYWSGPDPGSSSSSNSERKRCSVTLMGDCRQHLSS